MYTFVLFSVVLCCNVCSTYKILGITPSKVRSHRTFLLPLLEELSRKGHEVTLMSHFVKDAPTAKYKNITISLLEKDTHAFDNIEIFHGEPPSTFIKLLILNKLRESHNDVLNQPQLIASLKENYYDVVIVHHLASELFYGLFHRLNSPVIGFTSSNLLPWQEWALGMPFESAHFPMLFTSQEMPMNFWNRFLNTLEIWMSLIVHNLWYLPQIQKTAETYFGSVPDIATLEKNVSLVLVNSHFSIFGSKPSGPNVVEVGGIHLTPAKRLPQDLQQILDNSEHGVIYFSFGSSVSGDKLREDKKNAFLKVFSRLKQTVLWKIQTNFSIEKPSNVITLPWFPQKEILVHPKVILFISQCGILSTIESINSSTPMICIPLFADQRYIAQSVQFRKVSVTLDFSTITEASVEKAIDQVISNPVYKENVEKLSTIFKDRAMSPLDTAVYWVEYVIRHKGAPHIGSAAKDLYWFQHYNIDTFIVFILLVSLALVLLVHSIQFTFRTTKILCYNVKLKIS